MLKYFCNKYGAQGSIFGHMFGRSKNVPTSIAIGQESLISHVGIITTPNKNHNYIKKPRTSKKTLKMFAIFRAY